MGLFGKLFKKKDDLFANASELTMEEIEKIQLSLKDRMSPDTYNSVFNQACRLIPKKKYTQAISLFESIRDNTTDAHEKGNCNSQIGVCHFFLGDYEKALEHYTLSFHSGYGRDVADFNIWEVCEKLMKQDGNSIRWAQHYLDLFPDGQYAGKAQKYLS